MAERADGDRSVYDSVIVESEGDKCSSRLITGLIKYHAPD